MRVIKKLLFILFVFGAIAVSAFVGYSFAYTNLILPKIEIAGVEVGGLDKETAVKYLNNKKTSNPNKTEYFVGDRKLEGINQIHFETDVNWAVDQAMSVGRGSNLIVNLRDRIERLRLVRKIEIPLVFNESELDEAVEQIKSKVEIEPVWPKLLEVNNEIILNKGKNGVQVVDEKLKHDIRTTLARFGKNKVFVPTVFVNTDVDQKRIDAVLMLVKSWGDDGLIIRYKEYNKKLIKREILPLIGLINQEVDEREFEKLTKEIKAGIETESKNAVFVFEDNKVKEFQPEIVGVKVDIGEFQKRLGESLFNNLRDVEVSVLLDYPKIRTGDINNMGIKELIGTGTSSFGHSIPGRVFNVNLAGSRINGVIVPPGEEFSFNKTVGEISRTTGYQTAYVISEGRTVLGDGGGVCQVSTTVFRAALNAGFQITERKAHAYRVGYYEQDSAPGIDATIFSPSTDLKFLNDTGHHILIQTKVDTKNMTMRVEIYGTSDGRVATVSKPVISSQSAPPPTLYTDDPTLPAGQLKQIDFAAGGAKVSFDYKVERGGEMLFQKTFFSNYQPWRAVYLRGVGQ